MSTMSMTAAQQSRRQQMLEPVLDMPLLLLALTLLGIGLVMIASASVSIADKQMADPFYYLTRQGAYVVLGLLLAALTLRTPLSLWEEVGPMLLLMSAVLLLTLFIPGLGKTVNGSTRWLSMGPFNFQVSELAKLAMVIYLAGYLVRRGEAVKATVSGFLLPMAIVGLFGVFLLAEPDFGAFAVITATAMGMMFLGGVRLWLFGVLVMLASGAFAALAVSSPYRMQRLTAFLNPWEDPFNSGFQLTQSLIAFGRGDWFGVGLGGSIQKLFYLPEAHTDFVFAVLGEELGLIGVLTVIALYGAMIYRILRIGQRAATRSNLFAAYLTYGLGLWLTLQAVINMGVNMGILPTKGLTLPLMSYGGSSMLVSCIAIALVLRVGIETRLPPSANGRHM